KYLHAITMGTNPKPYFSLTDFLFTTNFIDKFPKDSYDREYATFYNIHGQPMSRVDQIWFSEDLIDKGFLFDRVWQLPFTRLNTQQGHNLDHRCVIAYFTQHILA